jgi:superoxide dismutase, Cu-Zn family
MQRRRLISLVAGTALAAAAVTALAQTGGSADSAGSSVPTAQATVKDATGAVLGTVTLRQVRSNAVQVAVSLTRLTTGFHGFHIHTIGTCNPADVDANGNPAPFTTAGGHFNPAAVSHGQHAGDLPALLVTARGTDTVVEVTDRFAVASLFDADGSAVIVHALPDNLANIPARYSAGGVAGPDAATLATGDSGGRTGCGVFVRK